MYCSFSWCFCFMIARWLWYRAMYSPARPPKKWHVNLTVNSFESEDPLATRTAVLLLPPPHRWCPSLRIAGCSGAPAPPLAPSGPPSPAWGRWNAAAACPWPPAGQGEPPQVRPLLQSSQGHISGVAAHTWFSLQLPLLTCVLVAVLVAVLGVSVVVVVGVVVFLVHCAVTVVLLLQAERHRRLVPGCYVEPPLLLQFPSGLVSLGLQLGQSSSDELLL